MQNSSRKIQIGIMGSTADLGYSKTFERLAEEIGYWVAKKGATLVFGAERDYDSLSTAACRGAKRAGGLTVGVTYGKGLNVFEKNVDVVIASGLERGGGRELSLVLSCDAIIAISGGSGTLTEIAIAYQANIPVVVLRRSGGWSDSLAGKYLDSRKRVKVKSACSPKEAVIKALRLAKKQPKSRQDILFLTAVHGNEDIGVQVVKKLEKEVTLRNFSWVVANEKALKNSKRFINADLNRVAPGNKCAREYERRRAYELLRICRSYRYVIDIHGTDAKTGIFTIVTNSKLENLFLANQLPIKNIVIWPNDSDNDEGPLTQFVKCGVEIECGPKNSKEIQKELLEILRYIVEKVNFSDIASSSSKNIFIVYGKISQGEISKKEANRLKEFQQVTINQEKFYPIFIRRYKDIVCYKMRKIKFAKFVS